MKSTLHKSIPLSAGHLLEVRQGDITEEAVDAIVNAANSHLLHGGGVAATIVRRGGWVIQQESDAWIEAHGPVTNAEPAYTSGGSLRCKYIIHAVGPIWGEGNEDDKLAAAVEGSLRLAEKLGVSSIAFPAISTGIYNFPTERAARVFMQVFQKYFAEHPATSIKLVRLVLYDAPSLNDFLIAAQTAFPEN
jgi:O-acetyl-ADP-ribose deacetylase (regulator of RNase III)